MSGGSPPMTGTGYLARRLVAATGDPLDGSFRAVVEAEGFSRLDYYDRPIVVTGERSAQGDGAPPNVPRFDVDVPAGVERIPLTIQVVAPRVLRLRFGQVAPTDHGILLDPEPPGLPLDASEGERDWTVTAGDLSVTIGAEPFTLRIDGPDGPSFSLADHDRNVFGMLITPPLATLDGTDGPRATVAWALAAAERLYGLGERFTAFNQRGRQVRLWNTDAWGTTTSASYKNCPIVCSSAGYAVFAHTTARVEADLGARSSATCSLTVDEDGLDLFVFLGPDLKAVLRDYTALTGRMPMIPRWAFGLWASRCRYQTREEVEEVVARMRAEELPLDVVNLDPAWLHTPNLTCDFVWNEDAFPDPAGMIRSLGEEGVKVCLWECPYLGERTPGYQEARERGYLLLRTDGAPIDRIDGSFAADGRGRGIVDFTNPEAVAWWQALHAPLLDMGVAAFKTDFGEGIPPEAQPADGLDGRRLRNLSPFLYNRAVWEATARARGAGFVWGRSGWAGSQRYPAQWGGDPAATVDGFHGAIRGGLNWALSAPGAWSHDIGGFSGAPPSPGLYIRWAQCGLLSPLARFHGTTPREPWVFGETALTVFRDYARLRYRLLPYLYAVAWEAHRDGLPMLRPLALEFPGDRAARDIDDQYLLGPALLVAPVFSDSLEPVDRSVYLPAGEWIDVWTGELIPGGRFLDLSVPIEQAPLFLRRGALLPMGPVMRHVDEVPADPLTIRCAPAGDAALELPEADGSLTRLTVASSPSRLTLNVEGSIVRRYEFELLGIPEPTRSGFAGRPITVVPDRGGVHVRTPPVRGGTLVLYW